MFVSQKHFLYLKPVPHIHKMMSQTQNTYLCQKKCFYLKVIIILPSVTATLTTQWIVWP